MDIKASYDSLTQAMRDDPQYAWGWLCNIAMPLSDSAGMSHEQANVTAAYLMDHLFGIDITTNERFAYQMGGAQKMHRLMMNAEGR